MHSFFVDILYKIRPHQDVSINRTGVHKDLPISYAQALVEPYYPYNIDKTAFIDFVSEHL